MLQLLVRGPDRFITSQAFISDIGSCTLLNIMAFITAVSNSANARHEACRREVFIPSKISKMKLYLFFSFYFHLCQNFQLLNYRTCTVFVKIHTALFTTATNSSGNGYHYNVKMSMAKHWRYIIYHVSITTSMHFM